MQAAALSCYVQSINDGGVPTVAHAWDAVKQMQSQKAFGSALEEFKRNMATDADGEIWNFPTEEARLKEKQQVAKGLALKSLLSNTLDRDEVLLAELKAAMKAEYLKLVNHNAAEVRTESNAMLRGAITDSISTRL